MGMNGAIAALNLPPAVKVQTFKLLARIRQAFSADELWRASNRAAGFVLELETVAVLDSASIDGLYSLFNMATAARLRADTL
ncbi:hypothetical protein [Pseudomonas chlororaphis]|uniref:hypothetical protein n=1 Tax=Pseudomonas chlororaphis TaxID=587753 RepID=UPI00047007A7|nr:hypothetical protein [Pseudomonas chlororaphis]